MSQMMMNHISVKRQLTNCEIRLLKLDASDAVNHRHTRLGRSYWTLHGQLICSL